MTAARHPKTVVVTGAAGALGSAYVRALVAHGHTARAVDRRGGALVVHTHGVRNPYVVLGPESRRAIEITSLDLAAPSRTLDDILRGADAVVMTAANPHADQDADSAATNHAIDRTTIDAALSCGVGTIIYLSSVWRLAGLLDGDAPIRPDMSAPRGHYGASKQRTWDLMRARATTHASTRFVVNDHGWYPREALGAPPTNVAPRGLQTWVAERETQQHILEQIALTHTGCLPGNFHGFIVASHNAPTPEATRHGHPPFILDLSSSAQLGIEHRANVYHLLEQYRIWRDLPICMD